jgi:hypothetical protein
MAGVVAIGVLGVGVFGVGRLRDVGTTGPRSAAEGGGLVVEEEMGVLDRLLGHRPRLFVTLPAATTLEVELQTAISSATATAGERFTARLRAPVRIEGVEALGEGAPLLGRVAHVSSAERAGGRGALTLELESATLADGGTQELEAAPVVLRAPPPVQKEKRGLRGRIQKVGAAVGELLGRKQGAGATMGGVAGATLASGEDGVDVEVSSGNTVDVQLTAPVTIAVRPEP